MKHLNQNRRLWASGGRISEAGAAGAAAWLRHEGVVAKRPHQDEGLGDGSLHPGGNSDVENPTREIMYRKWSTNAGENPHRSVSFQEASGVPKFGVKSQSGRKNIPNALHLEPYSINQRLTTISILVFDHRKQLVVVDVPRDIDHPYPLWGIRSNPQSDMVNARGLQDPNDAWMKNMILVVLVISYYRVILLYIILLLLYIYPTIYIYIYIQIYTDIEYNMFLCHIKHHIQNNIVYSNISYPWCCPGAVELRRAHPRAPGSASPGIWPWDNPFRKWNMASWNETICFHMFSI